MSRREVASPQHGLVLWLACFSSLGALSWLGLLAAFGGRVGSLLRIAVFLAAFAGIVWLVASTELWLEQDRPLLWDEIVFRMRDGPSRPLVLESLLSARVAGFALAFIVLAALLRRATSRLSAAAAAGFALLIVNAAQLAGLLFPLLGVSGDFSVRAVCAPWTLAARYLTRAALAEETVLLENLDGARSVRRELAEALWASGPDPALQGLAGRYRRRDVVLVLLESHRLADVAPFGEGSHGYRPLSPFLSRLAARSLSFTNYVATGPTTFFAQFSVATGLPGAPALRSGGVRGGGAYGGFGRYPDFTADGYRVEWLQATPVTFDFWDRYLLAAGVFGWIDPGEAKRFGRADWTSFGMPDEQLYALAWDRYTARAASAAPYFLTVLTVSNHHPYRFPKRPELEGLAGHQAGALYADSSLEPFVERLLALPEPERPLVLVTADHAHRWGLEGAAPLGPYNLESIRLPGFLVTPDGFRAGESCASLFSHEDVLDFLYLLVGPPQPAGSRKLLDRHRVAAAVATDTASSVFTARSFLLGTTGEAYSVEGPWRLLAGVDAEERARLEAARGAVKRQLDRIWTKGAPR